ncbi:MAG: LysR family transcriptional regulator [Acetobacter sp.]|jgi:DNA-binding transcriptional LysR family regulator
MIDLLSHLRIFIDIADHGSLAVTARARGCVPSAITASLQRLEQHVGARLVLRSTRKLSLTPEGEIFLQRCRSTLGDLDEAIDQVCDNGPLKGTIRLTAINDFGRSTLSRVINDFQALHPEVRFELSLGDEVVDLIEGGYDLAIRTGPLFDSRLTARLILRSRRSVCASPDYWLRHGKPCHPEELKEYNCLVLARVANPQVVWPFVDGKRRISIHVSGNRMTNDGGLLRHWAIEGLGVVLKSDYDVAADITAGRLEKVLESFNGVDVNLYAVHAAGRQPSRRVSAFIDFLTEYL